MEVNLWSNKWILDCLFKDGPTVKQVVAISSGASVSGSRGWNGYSLSKAALNMMVKLYAGEILDTHFCSFAPGLIDTSMQAYISGLPDDERFSTVGRLKLARGTEEMPDPDKAAEMLTEAFPKLMDFPSGSFVDVRKL
jgi:NAD(P)-dependent dehydrogenase (short-subunit alcohol dehydrogenase family)